MATLSAFRLGHCKRLFDRASLIKQCMRRKGNSSHYDVLGVSKGASAAEIKKAYIKRSKELHPDISKDVSDNEEFIKVQEAYQILSKGENKKDYEDIAFSKANADSLRMYEVPVNPFRASLLLHLQGSLLVLVVGVVLPTYIYYHFRVYFVGEEVERKLREAD